MKTFDNCFYVGSIDEFRKDNYDKNNNCVKKSFLDSLEKRYNNIYPNGRDIDNERKAWKDSLKQMHNRFSFEVKNTKKFISGNCGVMIEYVFKNYPGEIEDHWHRADFIICGRQKENINIIVIELKSWSKDGKCISMLKSCNKWADSNHPMNQVFKYQDIIKKSNKYVNEDNVNVYSCAYLHNIQNKNIDWIRNKVPAGNMSKLFFCGEGNDMKQWIYDLTIDTSENEGKEIASKFLNSEIINLDLDS